jgi:hypothetical protein
VNEDAADGYYGSSSLGLPIVGNHSIRLDLFAQQLDYGRFAGTSFEQEAYGADMAWIYDTTDDPLFPSRGSKVIGSAGYDTVLQTDEDFFGRSEERSDSYRT